MLETGASCGELAQREAFFFGGGGRLQGCGEHGGNVIRWDCRWHERLKVVVSWE